MRKGQAVLPLAAPLKRAQDALALYQAEQIATMGWFHFENQFWGLAGWVGEKPKLEGILDTHLNW